MESASVEKVEMDVDCMIDVVFECKICSVQTPTKNELRLHVKTLHTPSKDGTSTLEDVNASDTSQEVNEEVETFANQSTVSDKPRCSKRRRNPPARFADDVTEYDIPKKSRKMKQESNDVEQSVLLPNDIGVDDGAVKEKCADHQLKLKKISVEIQKPDDEFECNLCGAVYKEAKAFKIHSKTHKQNLKSCPKCKYRFKTQEDLQIHMNCHYMNIFKCALCDYTHVHWNRVKIHMETHNDPDKYQCQICGQSFASRFTLYSHKRFNHLGGVHLCDECGFEASSKYVLVQHKMKMHEANLACPHCGHKCDNQVDMKEHVKSRHETGYICKRCKPVPGSIVRYPTKTSLLSHMESVHNGEKCYFCDKCNYVAKLQHHLTKHDLTHTGYRPYACSHDGCDFRTRDHRSLKQHLIMKHRKPGELVCRSCRFVTTNQNEWDVHQAMFHMNVYQCSQCAYESHSQSSIRRHRLAKHTADEKMRYPCPHCSYKTNFRESLQKHLFTHIMKSTNFKCLFCDLQCNEREDMKDHLSKVHSDKEAYTCAECSYIAKNKNLHRQHKKTHNSERSFACNKCDYRSRTKMTLQSHVLHKHTLPRDNGAAEQKDLNVVPIITTIAKPYEHDKTTNFVPNVNSDVENGSITTSSIANSTQPPSTPTYILLPDDKSKSDQCESPKVVRTKKVSIARQSKKIQEDMRRISEGHVTPVHGEGAPMHVTGISTPSDVVEVTHGQNSYYVLQKPSYVILSPPTTNADQYSPQIETPHVPLTPTINTDGQYVDDGDGTCLPRLVLEPPVSPCAMGERVSETPAVMVPPVSTTLWTPEVTVETPNNIARAITSDVADDNDLMSLPVIGINETVPL